jgi:glycine betaine/proline transport system substrate-binding protein
MVINKLKNQLRNHSLVKKIGVLSLLVVFASHLVSVQAASKITANLGDIQDEIIIPTHNWSSQIVMSKVVGQLFEKLGYRVKYLSTDSHSVYESVRLGDVHLEMEVWEVAFAAQFNAALDKGGILDAGNHDAITRQEWWYPAYVAELCPGLPDYKALERCYKLFVTPETKPDARFLDGPVIWQHDTRRIEALDMPFSTINADTVAALWAELESAAGRQTPIVLFNWSPNFTDAVYGGAFVEFPEFDPACKIDASWGPNPNSTHDCGSPAGGYLKKVAWDGMPRKWPAAYKILLRINFTTLMVGTMSKLVDVDGMGYDEAAARWITDNEEVWSDWLYASQ